MRFHEFKKISEMSTPMDTVWDITNKIGNAALGNKDAVSSTIGAVGSTLGAVGTAAKAGGNAFSRPKSKVGAAELQAIQDPNFNNKLQKIANALGVKADDLLAIMRFESGVDPSKYNAAGSKAVGLIQFMPDTAADLGTSTAALAKMSAVEQLDYVYLYYKKYLRPGATRGDMYLATFYPAAVGKNDNFVIGRQGDPGMSGLIYKQNGRALDVDRNKVITAGDVRNAIG